jgi:TetR/AcrR family transcriptional regulator, transcriptional repressor for nem operon
MTNSTATASGKRERLVAGARELVHQHGVQRTSLAEIAQAAGVPPGNVYYYFKTKDELVDAVVDSYIHDAEKLLGMLDRQTTPNARLKALVHHWVEMRDEIVARGCPMGSLAGELGKADGPDAGALFGLLIEWVERQFRDLGAPRPRDLALVLVSGIQGAALLTNIFRDPEILIRECRHLDAWIDTIGNDGT